jgi:SAM-dependent methyltransferase
VSAAYTQLAAARHEAGRGSRGQGPIAKALAFNCALREAAFQSCACASPLGRVVSLCDGQCPDLDHALRQGVQVFHCFDQADGAVQEARRRMAGALGACAARESLDYRSVLVHSCFDTDFLDAASAQLGRLQPYDAAINFFGLHYAFATRHLAERALRVVGGLLRPGGRFAAIVPDEEVVEQRAREVASKEGPDTGLWTLRAPGFGWVMSMHFPEGGEGRHYYFNFRRAQGFVSFPGRGLLEHAVRAEWLASGAAAAGLRPLTSVNALAWGRMADLAHGLDDANREFVRTYRVLVFEKVDVM